MTAKSFIRIWTLGAWLVIAFILLPLVVVVLGSLTDKQYLSLPFDGMSLRWYAEILNQPKLVDGFIKSVQLGAVAAILATLLGTAGAIGLARCRRGAAAAVSTILMLPLVIPSVITSIALLQFFSALKVTSPYLTLFLSHTIITIPYVVRTVTASISFLARNLEWAGANLGAGPWRVIWHVILPNIRPGIIGGLIFAFFVSFDTVTLSIFLQSPSFIPLPVRMYNFIEFGVSPVLASVSTLLIAFTATGIYIAGRFAGIEPLLGLRR